MKTPGVFAGLWLGLSLSLAVAQVVKDPLRDYYETIKRPDFDPQFVRGTYHYSPETKVYYFEANFSGPGRKSAFITDGGEDLGGHGQYAWSVYCPVESGGFRLVSDNTHFVSGGLDGPDYVGYVDQIKRYGVVIGTKHSVAVYYLDSGTIQSKAIDLESGHANAEVYPKYFSAKANNYQVKIFTLAELAQKYAKPDPGNILAPATK